MIFAKRGSSKVSGELQLCRKLTFLVVLSLLVQFALGGHEFNYQSRTLDDLIKEELDREKIKQPESDIKEQRNLNSKTMMDQLIEAEQARENAESSDIKERENLKSGISGGAVYTRWGRSECPSGSEIVYRGVAGGSHFDEKGGGSNYLCLSLTPLWGYYNDGGLVFAKVYGAELQFPDGLDLSNNGGNSLQDSNVLCVVCRSLSKSSVVMIPGRNRCYSGWEPEYDGYLMTGAYTHASQNDYACMDRSPEGAPGDNQDENGALFHHVKGVCGSLPCPPYVAGRELTCVVCGK